MPVLCADAFPPDPYRFSIPADFFAVGRDARPTLVAPQSWVKAWLVPVGMIANYFLLGFVAFCDGTVLVVYIVFLRCAMFHSGYVICVGGVYSRKKVSTVDTTQSLSSVSSILDVEMRWESVSVTTAGD